MITYKVNGDDLEVTVEEQEIINHHTFIHKRADLEKEQLELQTKLDKINLLLAEFEK